MGQYILRICYEMPVVPFNILAFDLLNVKVKSFLTRRYKK
jgi:hypothetical protein